METANTTIEMTKPEIIAKLQDKGLAVNPNANKETLMKQLEATGEPITTTSGPAPVTVKADVMSDTQRILEAISGLAKRVDSVTTRVDRMQDGGKNEFKNNVQSEDVENASKNKEGMDPKIVRIVEETLGVDFGVTIDGFIDKPGFLLTLHVPKRLSNIPETERPLVDRETGTYVIDPKTKLPSEERYWPGDRRSVALGSTASYDVIQQHCNRVRSFIVAYYQKTSKPLPEFRIK